MTDFVSGGGQPFVASGNNDGGGFGGGGAIWAIVLLALLGGGFNRGRGEGCDNNVDFAELNNRIDNVNSLAEQRANLKEVCDGHMATLESKSDIIQQVIESKYDTALQLERMQAANAACCCETQRSIDRASFENAKGQWDISKQISDCCCSTNLNMERGFNSILTRMDQDKIETLRDKLAEERLINSQCRQNAELINALRPFPNPAFGVNPPYAPAGFSSATGYGYCAC